jgi:pimeloyl-ACP methyl ester carboxylesterase
MSRHEKLFAAVGILILALSAAFLLYDHIPAREVVLTQACDMPIRIMNPPIHDDVPAAVVLHGLGANAVVMRSLGQFLANMGFRVYLLDLPGHGNNQEPFSFARAEDCAAKAIAELERSGEIRLEKTVLIGHSMGGALAIRMADYFPTAATIAISPAPMIRAGRMPPGAVLMSPPRRMPVNLLILMGQFDFPYSRESAEELVRMGGGQRGQPEDFHQKRALNLVTVPRATHTSLIFNVPYDSALVSWLQASASENVRLRDVHLIKPESWGVLGLFGLLLLFPLAASSTARVFKLRDSSVAAADLSVLRAILYWIAAALFAVTALKFVPQFNFLRMQYGGYLASCLLLAGIALIVLMRMGSAKDGASRSSAPNWRGMLAGALLGIATMIIVGAWMTLQLSDTWLNAPRWPRFFPAVLACLPYALAEEWALGAPSAGSLLVKIRRYFLFTALRLLIWLSMLFALYVYSSGQILLSVLVFYMGIFSIFTRLGADAVRRRTGSPAGAAVFTAILMAWFIAAVFPLT